MRRTLTLLLLLLLIPLLFCLKERNNPDIPAYLPLATGNYWVYESRDFEILGSDTTWDSDATIIRYEVGAKKNIAGKEFFEIIEISDYGPWVRYYMRAEDKFLLIYSPQNEDTIIDTLMHHQNFHGGRSWYLKGEDWEPEYQLFKADYDGTEVINLPIGSFDCIKVDYTSNPDEENYGVFYLLDTESHIFSFWYGKDVGIVKIEAVYDYGDGDKDGTQWKLINYNCYDRAKMSP